MEDRVGPEKSHESGLVNPVEKMFKCETQTPTSNSITNSRLLVFQLVSLHLDDLAICGARCNGHQIEAKLV